MLQEVINDVIIQDVCSAAQKNEDQDSMAVELLLVGLDEVERVSGLPNDIVGICRCLISKFAATCGDHIASILGTIVYFMQTDPSQGCMTAITYCILRVLCQTYIWWTKTYRLQIMTFIRGSLQRVVLLPKLRGIRLHALNAPSPLQ